VDFSSCACLPGRQHSDGRYHSVSACPDELGDLKVSVFEGMSCNASAKTSGSIPAAFVPVLARGECVQWRRFGFDKALRIEKGANYGVEFKMDAAETLYSFEDDDKFVDLAWYGESEQCAASGDVAGGWRFVVKKDVRPDFSTCQCNAGLRLSDGQFRSVHMCKNSDDDVEVRVHKGLECSEDSDMAVKGKVSAGSVPMMLRGECVPLKVSLGFDKTLRLEKGLELGCECGSEDPTPLVDGTGRNPAPMLTKGDGIFDFAWYSSEDACKETTSPSGSFRLDLAGGKELDVSKYGPLYGRDIGSGMFYTMSMCVWSGGIMGLTIWEGVGTGGSKALEGYLKTTPVAYLKAQRCAVLTVKLGFDKHIRIDERLEVTAKCPGEPPEVAQIEAGRPTVSKPDDKDDDKDDAGSDDRDGGTLDGASSINPSVPVAMLAAAVAALFT